MTMLLGLAFLLLQGFFAGSETSFTKANWVRLKTWSRNRRLGAARAQKLLENKEKVLVCTLIGTNLSVVLASMLVVNYFATNFGVRYVGLATILVCILSLIFSEFLPKTIAQAFPDHWACFASYPLLWTMKILSPVSNLLYLLARIGRQSFLDSGSIRKSQVSDQTDEGKPRSGDAKGGLPLISPGFKKKCFRGFKGAKPLCDEGKPLISPGFKKKCFRGFKGAKPLCREDTTGFYQIISKKDFIVALREYFRLPDEASEGSPKDRTYLAGIAYRLFEFSKMKVAEVAIPLARVVAVPEDTSLANLYEAIKKFAYSRYPVYKGNPANITGVMHTKDLLYLPRKRIRRAYVVSSQARAMEVLTEMRHRGEHLAVVKDETNKVIGIVTLEDLVEELVGEIRSED